MNGDFEAGQVAPWQGGELFANPSGGLCARVGDPSVGDSISQATTTAAGKRYLVSGEVRSTDQSPSPVTVIARSQAGIVDGSKYAIAPADAFRRFAMVFTASTAGTTIEIGSSGLGDYVLIDNVSMIVVPPGAEGPCAGTIVTTVTVTDPALSAKSSRKVSGRIDAAGELILLDGTKGIITGSILPTGEFSLVLADGTEVSGIGVVRGRRIELEYLAGSYEAITSSGAPVPNAIREVVVLTRR